MKDLLITSCGNSQKLAQKLQAKYSPLTLSQFPDGDLYLKFNTVNTLKITKIVYNCDFCDFHKN